MQRAGLDKALQDLVEIVSVATYNVAAPAWYLCA